MKNLLFLPLLLLALTTSFAQSWWGSGIDGKGPRVERTLELESFDGLKLSIAADVYLKKGNSQSVEISAQQNIIDLIKTEVVDGVWKITTNENIDDYTPIKIYVTVPRMDYVAISGSGDIYTEGTFTDNDKVTVAVSGSGDLRFRTTARTVSASVSGSGDIELAGSALDVNLRVSGSGDIDAYDFETADCEVRVSGSGGAKVNAVNTLNVRVSGSGDVFYKGQPNVTSRISGSGDLHATNG